MVAAGPLRFGTDGVRGVVDSELTPEFVRCLGRAVARVLRPDTVVVGQDTRESSPMLAAALVAGVSSEGVDVVDAGVLPTPAVAWLAARSGAAGAVVTASHNPYTDNGVKVFAAGGRKLRDDTEAAIEAELHRVASPAASGRAAGAITQDRGAADRYVAHIVALFPGTPLLGLRLVVDCANGAMAAVAPAALAALGATVHAINDRPDGRNINDRCGATHAEVMATAVRELGADAGLAFDGDGDRVIAAGATGELIDGDRLMAVLAPRLKADGRLSGNAVAVTVMTNLGFRRAMAAAGIDVIETPVGDRYVLEALEDLGLSLGGEQSGHVILRDLATTGDGLLAGAALLTTARRTGRPLHDVAREAMTSLPQVLVNVRTSQQVRDVDPRVADEVAAVRAELGDDGRVLVRRSGTEPLVRVMVEAPTIGEAQRAAERIAAAVAAT